MAFEDFIPLIQLIPLNLLPICASIFITGFLIYLAKLKLMSKKISPINYFDLIYEILFFGVFVNLIMVIGFLSISEGQNFSSIIWSSIVFSLAFGFMTLFLPLLNKMYISLKNVSNKYLLEKITMIFSKLKFLFKDLLIAIKDLNFVKLVGYLFIILLIILILFIVSIKQSLFIFLLVICIIIVFYRIGYFKNMNNNEKINAIIIPTMLFFIFSLILLSFFSLILEQPKNLDYYIINQNEISIVIQNDSDFRAIYSDFGYEKDLNIFAFENCSFSYLVIESKKYDSVKCDFKLNESGYKIIAYKNGNKIDIKSSKN